MHFNNQRAWAEMMRRQAAEQAIMRDAGMPEQSIDSIFALDREQLRGDRRYCVHVEFYIEPDGNALEKAETAASLKLMDEIEDEKLHAALSGLNPQERDLVILHAADGLPLCLIAALWGKPYTTIEQRYHRAIQKIRKFF